MSQRNPMNERYTGEDRAGKTRKSAASAKPSSRAAASVRVESPSSGKKGRTKAGQKASNKAKRRSAEAERYSLREFDSPEYKKWRNIWWSTIIGAMVLTGVSLFLFNGIGTSFGIVALVAGYALLAASIIIDIKKVRKLRNEHYAFVKEDRSKEATKTRKEKKAEYRQVEATMVAEAEAKEAAKEAKREARTARRKKTANKTEAQETGEA